MAQTILAVDQRGWCFHNIARQISPRLSDISSFEIRIAREIVKGPCDCLVAFWWGDALRLKANTKAGSMITCLYDHLSWKTPGHRALAPEFALTLKQTAVLLVCNKNVKAELLALARGPLPPIIVAPDGVDQHLFDFKPLPVEFKVGWAGNAQRFAPTLTEDHKGVHCIKEACKIANVKLRYLDASSGDPWEQWEMPKFYDGISVYLCASLSEGTPNPVLEAMSCGRPVISTPVGVVPEVITAGRNGLIVKRDPREMASAIETLRRTFLQGGLAQMGRNARDAIVSGNWSWDDRVEPWKEALKICLGQIKAPMCAPPVSKPARPAQPEPLIQAVATADRPRVDTAGRHRVLLMDDVPDWAFAINMQDWHLWLDRAGKYLVEHYHVIDLYHGGSMPQWGDYAAVFSPYHRWPTHEHLPFDRALGSLRALWFIPELPGPPTKQDIALVNRFKAFHVVTRKNYEELAPHCPNVVYLTNPVNMERFSDPTEVDDRVILSWNGNAQHQSAGSNVDVKGFKTIIEPVCKEQGYSLVFADYSTCRLPPDQMSSFYKKANVSVCMSLYEGASNSTLEAMAAGQALISTDCGNVREMQQAQLEQLGDTGIIIVERSKSALASAVSMLKNLGLSRIVEMGQLNRAEIQARWSWEVWAKRYEEFLCRAIS